MIRTFLVADFEFTVCDFGPGRPRAFFPEVIEAGAVRLDPPDYAETEIIETFVKPKFFPKLKPECTNITMIQQKDIDKGISFEDLLSRLSAVYSPGETYLVCWGDSDQLVIDAACRRYGIPCPFDWKDYIDLAAAYKLSNSLPRTAGLQQAVAECQIEKYGMSHLALDDAVNAARVMKKMLERGWTP